jgi:copper chaperone CopZ
MVQPETGEPPESNINLKKETSVMQTSQANVVVDLKQVISRKHGDELESELGGIRGVSRVQVSPRARRLVLVDYDPETVNSQKILGTVVRHGFDARLIGM